MDETHLPLLHLYRDLAVGLGIGLLVGLERGWMSRDVDKGQRVAGIRTFGLLGIVGCGAGLALRIGQPWVAGAAILGSAVLLVAGYLAEARQQRDLGATTATAGLAALLLATLAAAGSPGPAAALGVMAVILLAARRPLHAGIASLDAHEVQAVLRFLVLAAVVLPLLPDRGYGPYAALNPYSIGFMVVLLSGLSFAGYWATRILGARHGLLLTAAFGGLVSSTAVTLALARLSKTQSLDVRATAAAITVASLVMLVRVLFLSAFVAQPLLPLLLWPVGTALVVGIAVTALLWWRSGESESVERPVGNPFELKPALFFASVLAAVTLGTRWAADQFGAGGVLAVSAITGLVDADSVIIANGRLLGQGVAAQVAANGILTAVLVNTLSKAMIAILVAVRPIGWTTAALLLVVAVAGAAGWYQGA